MISYITIFVQKTPLRQKEKKTSNIIADYEELTKYRVLNLEALHFSCFIPLLGNLTVTELDILNYTGLFVIWSV